MRGTIETIILHLLGLLLILEERPRKNIRKVSSCLHLLNMMKLQKNMRRMFHLFLLDHHCQLHAFLYWSTSESVQLPGKDPHWYPLVTKKVWIFYFPLALMGLSNSFICFVLISFFDSLIRFSGGQEYAFLLFRCLHFCCLLFLKCLVKHYSNIIQFNIYVCFLPHFSGLIKI